LFSAFQGVFLSTMHRVTAAGNDAPQDILTMLWTGPRRVVTKKELSSSAIASSLVLKIAGYECSKCDVE
jgi:hypothetical protein